MKDDKLTTWSDETHEYTTDGEETQSVKRNKFREAKLREEAELREKTKQFKENVKLLAFMFFSIVIVALVLQIIMTGG